MDKGFKRFMKNPYWKKEYDNAPSDALKEHYRLEMNNNKFICEEFEEGYREKRDAIESRFLKMIGSIYLTIRKMYKQKLNILKKLKN